MKTIISEHSVIRVDQVAAVFADDIKPEEPSLFIYLAGSAVVIRIPFDSAQVRDKVLEMYKEAMGAF